MKKKMIFAAIVAVATVSGIAGFSLQKQESNLNALTLANVEALSRWEFPSTWNDMWYVTYFDGGHHCEADGPDTCPGI